MIMRLQQTKRKENDDSKAKNKAAELEAEKKREKRRQRRLRKKQGNKLESDDVNDN
jgi:hypothetical protein